MSNSISEPLRSAAAEPLVAAEWLAGRLSRAEPGSPELRILDIRSVVDGGGRQAYEAGHIPGAIHSDYANDGWRVTEGMASGLLPEPAALVDLLSRIGLTPRHRAIIVSAGTTVGDFSAAARVYWTLKIAGHDSTSILSGGMLAWNRDAARPIETGRTPVHPPSPPYPIRLAPALRADVGAVERAIADRTAVLLDSRATAFFQGSAKSPQAMRPGAASGRAPARSRRGFRPHCNGVETQSRARKAVCSRAGDTRHQLLQHWPPGRDELVCPVRGARASRRVALRRLDVGMDARAGSTSGGGAGRAALVRLSRLALSPVILTVPVTPSPDGSHQERLRRSRTR